MIRGGTCAYINATIRVGSIYIYVYMLTCSKWPQGEQGRCTLYNMVQGEQGCSHRMAALDGTVTTKKECNIIHILQCNESTGGLAQKTVR